MAKATARRASPIEADFVANRAAPRRNREWRLDWGIYLGLLAITLFVYADVRSFDFVNFDDPEDVFGNIHVRRGLTAAEIKWAIVSGEYSNWMPLTRISRLADVQLSGLDAGRHHLTNVLLHALSTLLLFGFLRSATGARWRSAFVAGVFALHPLHVESVAWVAERKDVLYAVFWFGALWAYVRYVGRPNMSRYAIALVLFSLGLMAKPMMITLPFLLLLMDVWPLRRISLVAAAGRGRVLSEKIPFFVLAAASGVVTYLAQRTGGAVTPLSSFPLVSRLQNAIASYVAYIGKTIWPVDLAAFYPYPQSMSPWIAGAGFLALAGASILILRRLGAYPYLATGWFWYVGTLIPVIGLLQVGEQARADRYTYVPMVGLSIMAAWGASDLALRWPKTKRAMAAAAVLVCVLLAGVASAQIQYWKNTETLYRRALAVTEGNYVAENALGYYALDTPERAIGHFEAALRINPRYAAAHSGLGLALARVPGRLPEALDHLATAVRMTPNFVAARNNLGAVLLQVPGRLPEAVAHFQEAVRIQPGFAEGHANLAAALAQMPDRAQDALAQYSEALRLKPDLAEARFNLGIMLSNIPGRALEAIDHLQSAVALTPDFDTHYQLAIALLNLPGRELEALRQLQAAVQFNPRSADAHYRIAQVLSGIPGRSPEVVRHLEAALSIAPESEPARRMLSRLRPHPK